MHNERESSIIWNGERVECVSFTYLLKTFLPEKFHCILSESNSNIFDRNSKCFLPFHFMYKFPLWKHTLSRGVRKNKLTIQNLRVQIKLKCSIFFCSLYVLRVLWVHKISFENRCIPLRCYHLLGQVRGRRWKVIKTFSFPIA